MTDTNPNKVIEDLGRTFEEFKSANDANIKSKVKDMLTEMKLDRVNDTLDSLGDVKEAAELANKTAASLKELETAVQRGLSSGSLKGDKEGIIKTKQAAMSSEFNAFLRKGDSGLTNYEVAAEIVDMEGKALSVGSDPDGGYYVVPTILDKIITQVFETSPIRRLAEVVNVTNTDSVQFSVDRDVAAAGWSDSEQAPVTETGTPKVGQRSIVVHDQIARPKITAKLIEDAGINIEAWLSQKVSEVFARQEATAFIKGDGVARPKGILSQDTVAEANFVDGKLGFVVTGAASGFAGTNPGDAILDLFYSLKEEYATNAQFIMNRDVVRQIRKFKDGDGNYLWQQSFVIDQPNRLIGQEVINAVDMPKIAANSFSIAFGNFRRGYMIVDRRGLTVLRDPFTEQPFVKFTSTRRVGGDVTDFDAIKLLKTST